MAAIAMQKDLVVALKKEINLNVGILSKLREMPAELYHQVFKENAFEKPTQTLFNHLSHYLVCMIDPVVSSSLPWPLYDTTGERAYRNQLSTFISDYSNKGFLSPVMSSYLVNPGCYKVTVLLFQLSQLAIQKLLLSIMKENQTKLYNEMTEKFKSQEKEGFMKQIEKETNIMLNKFSNYMQKRKVLEKAAELLRSKITKMESKLQTLESQKYLDNLVDGYITKNKLDKEQMEEILKVKDTSKPAPLFDRWLLDVDHQIDEMESKWSEKMTPILSLSSKVQTQTEALIARCTGEADKSIYMIEYNHKSDFIDTKDLQTQVNSQQKYVLKNIVKEEKLNFPNLIRGFLIAISYVLKNEAVGDEIYKFNQYLDGGRRNYEELVLGLRSVIERVRNADSKLEPTPVRYHQSISIKEIPEIPPLPDLSDLRCTRELQSHAFDICTPLGNNKHQFNLRRRNLSFTKPQPKSLFTSFIQPREEFHKSLMAYKFNDRPQANVSHFHNMSVLKDNLNLSVIPKVDRVNETVAECTSGFTKQQILRLLSTKKSSSSKKFKYKTERPAIQIKKGGLFNESTNSSSESNGLFRSHSSPNLYERRPAKTAKRKLSIMSEGIGSLLEVSGIIALEKNNSFNSPTKIDAPKSDDLFSLPNITVTPSSDLEFNEMLNDFHIKRNLTTLTQEKNETPKSNAQLIKKTSSLEKIINRFKKVRSSVLPEKTGDFNPIAEEKESMQMFTANRVLLPDLLSPSCSVFSKPEVQVDACIDVDIDIDDCVRRRPRESLGTVLGVDQTFLDQFDLVD